MDQHREDFKNKLVGYIEDAYAMENQIVEVLERQIDETADYPEFQTRIRQHLEETKLHRKRMQERLAAYGKSPSTNLSTGLKSVVSNLMGMAVGASSGLRTETLARDVRDDFVTENLEIAAYTMLIASAKVYGDQETVAAAEANLRDEIHMQRWLAERLAESALLSLEAEGIKVPAGSRQSALSEAGGKLNVTFEPGGSQVQANK